MSEAAPTITLSPPPEVTLPDGWSLFRVNYTTLGHSRLRDVVCGAFLFLVHESVADAAAAIEAAVAAYCATSEAREDVGQTGVPPNWGDLYQRVTAEHWRRFGLMPLGLRERHGTAVVDHDQTFDVEPPDGAEDVAAADDDAGDAQRDSWRAIEARAMDGLIDA